MKADDARAKSDDELKEELLGLRTEAFNLRFQTASGQLQNTARRESSPPRHRAHQDYPW